MVKNTGHKSSNEDTGAILITMLLIVAVMSAMAVTLLDDIRFGVRRSVGAQAGDQARWYALGAETLAEKAITQSILLSPERTTLDQPWRTESGQFLVPGGVIDARLNDGSNCFNINSLAVQDEDQTGDANEGAQTILSDLFGTLGITDGDSEALVAALTDWVDPDSQLTPLGAEDYDYLDLSPAYRTPNTLVADISSIRAVSVVTPALFNRLVPYLCALPRSEPQPLNINTLEGEPGAILLAAILGEDITVQEATLILQDRPESGFESIEQFAALPRLAGKTLPDARLALLDVKTGYFALNARVVYGETDMAFESLFEVSEDGAVRQITRRFGEDG